MKRVYVGAITLVIAFLFCVVNAWAMSAPEFYDLARGRPGINAFAATIQSAHETGDWKSYLWINANNGAGIKAQAAWRSAGRPYIKVNSPESVAGTYVMRGSYFRKYTSPEEFLLDYKLKIIQDYPRSAVSADNMWGYFAGLYFGRLGSWATDHRYFEKLVSKSVQLAPWLLGTGWKKKLETAYALALKRNSLSKWQQKIIEKALKGCD